MASEKKLKVVLFAGYSCNNNCRFCVGAGKRELPDRSTAGLLRAVARARARGARILELIGGESTIRPDFLSVISAARQMGMEVVVATNGRMFSDKAFAAAAIKAGLGAAVFSVHGHSPAVHDALTRVPGSFGQLTAGIDNMRRAGFGNIHGNTTVVRQNMRHLPEIAEFYEAKGVRDVEYIFVDPSGGAKENFDSLVPRISAAAPWMRKALDIGNARGPNRWKVRYVPLCHFTGYHGQISELIEAAGLKTEHWAPDFINTDVVASRRAVARKKTGRCRGCRAYEDCEGIWAEYLRRFGDSELNPVR